MRIVFLWTGVTAPMAACWHSLADRPGVRLTVLSELNRRAQTAYDEPALMAGLDHTLRYADEPLDRRALVGRLVGLEPDVLVVLGWRSAMCRAAAESRELAGVPKILAFDLPFARTLRKLVAPIVLWRYLRRFAAAFVPGERAAIYARWLGFPQEAIERGLMAVDTERLAAADRQRRAAAGYPRRFLHVGRCAPEKGIRTLVAGYRRYREQVADPWPMSCCGMGPERHHLAGVAGIEELGFVQPQALPDVYATHGALVLASRFDPWPFVLLEAAASGLPIVCTTACGNQRELVLPGASRHEAGSPHGRLGGPGAGAPAGTVTGGAGGLVVPPGDPAALARALTWMHEHRSELPALGACGRDRAAAYGRAAWAARVEALCGRVAAGRPSPARAV